MDRGGDGEIPLDPIREEGEYEGKCANERESVFEGGESESGGEREKFGCGIYVKDVNETDRGEKYDIAEGGAKVEVKNEKGEKERNGTRGGEKCEIKGDDMKEDSSREENQWVDNVPVNDIGSHEGEENDDNNPNEIGTIESEMIDVEEGSTTFEQVEELVEDVLTPALKLLIFNFLLPCIDIFFDARLILSLHPQYLGCLLVILTGLILHFCFTCFAWWRLEPRAQKKWSWIFLILQIWPQMKAVQVSQKLIYANKMIWTISSFSCFPPFWFPGSLADTQRGSDCRKDTSDVRQGSEQS